MAAPSQSYQKSGMSGLTGLANLIQEKYPGYTRKKAFDLVMRVRNHNGGKLVGLRRKKLFMIVRKIVKSGSAQLKNVTKCEQEKRRELSLTCNYCYRMFIEKFSCDRHVRNVHQKLHFGRIKKVTVEKPSDCSVCGMTFSNSGNAKRHLRMHRETLPIFSCSVCGKSFNRKDNLVKHKERLHKLFRTNIDAIRDQTPDFRFFTMAVLAGINDRHGDRVRRCGWILLGPFTLFSLL